MGRWSTIELLRKDEDIPPIFSLAGYTSAADTYLVMGTQQGAYTAKLAETTADIFLSLPTLISSTENYSITKMAASGSGNIAMLSDRDLFIYNSTAETVMHYPFNSGLPGTLTDLAWAGTELLISGTAGLVSITPTP